MEGTNSYYAIDLETTGLDPKRDKIIEIGAAKIENGIIVERFQTLINPCRYLTEQTTALTGITNAMVALAPTIDEMIGKLVEFCNEESLPLLGHHIIFDYSFLKRAAVNQKLKFERSGMDTLTLCRHFMPESEKKNLKAACAFYGIEREQAHRAMADAEDTHLLYQTLLMQYGSRKPQVFIPKSLIYKVKREQSASKKQKEGLRYLAKYHKIDLSVQIDHLSRNEISRITDKIISQYGRIGTENESDR